MCHLLNSDFFLWLFFYLRNETGCPQIRQVQQGSSSRAVDMGRSWKVLRSKKHCPLRHVQLYFKSFVSLTNTRKAHSLPYFKQIRTFDLEWYGEKSTRTKKLIFAVLKTYK